jgi:hypothetical protein
MMSTAAKMVGRRIESIFEHDAGVRAGTPGRWPYYTYYIKTENGIVVALGFCSLEERTQVPTQAQKISLGAGDVIAGIYEFSDPDHEIRDPCYDTMFVVTDRREAIYDNFGENGNGLISMPWERIVEWDWEHNRMIDLSTGQIIAWDEMQRNIEMANKRMKASGGSGDCSW